MKTYATTRTIDLGAIGEVDCDVIYTYKAGTPESGCFGLPENYDPGEASECYVTSIMYQGVQLLNLFEQDALAEMENEICLECDEEEK
jgi:hypothetical protein